MLSYKQYIYEKRKNPSQNPKESVIDKLYDYAQGNDYFVSFRSINKLGINPSSKYDTPNGIYGYRLGDFEQSLETESKIKIIFPFTGDKEADYAYVFDYKDGANIIELGDLTRTDVITYMTNWFEKYPSSFNKFYNQEQITKRQETIDSFRKIVAWIDEIKEIDSLPELTKAMYNKEIGLGEDGDEKVKRRIITSIYQTLGEDFGLMDMQLALEDTAIDFSSSIEDFENDLKNMPNLDGDNKYSEMAEWVYANRSETLAEEDPRIDTYGGIFWWFGWTMYGHSPNKWNKFFRILGIDGVIDNECEGIIHKNEPCQAVFFDKTKLEVIEAIPNRDYKMEIQDYKVKTPEGIMPVTNAMWKYLDHVERYVKSGLLGGLDELEVDEIDNIEKIKKYINHFVIPMLKDEDNPDFTFKLVS